MPLKPLNFHGVAVTWRLNGKWRSAWILAPVMITRWHAFSWWRHQMETLSPLLAICTGNSPVTGEFPTRRPVTPSFDVFFDLRLNKRLGKQPWVWCFETPSCSLWRHCNVEYGALNPAIMVPPRTSKQLRFGKRMDLNNASLAPVSMMIDVCAASCSEPRNDLNIRRKHCAVSSSEFLDPHTTQTQPSEVRWGARFSGHWVATSMFA